MDNIALRIVVALVVILSLAATAAVTEVVTGVWLRIKDLSRSNRHLYRLMLMVIGAAWFTLAFWITYGRLPQ